MTKYEEGTVRVSGRQGRQHAMRNMTTGAVLYKVSGRVVTASAATAPTFKKV